MSDGDAPFELTVKVQRGNGTDDRDTLKGKVSAHSKEELDTRVSELRERIEKYSQEFRDIQPTKDNDPITEDQSTLQEVESDD